MDSWADPNVLFGPYDFATNSARLPEECKGGLGRDDGKFGEADTEGTPCEYFEQCHHNFPNSTSCNVHKFKEGLIYLAHISGAQIYASIGGWTLSGAFPTVAADSDKRMLFAQECVGLIADYGFDGIDIDWEYPGYEPHGGSPRDRDNFNKLLLEVREALNTYQSTTGDAPLGGGAFGLAATLPCGPANIDFLDVPFLSLVLDEMKLMTFDFHNELETVTGANSPLYDQEWDEEPGLSVDGCVKNYYEGGAGDQAAKISIGVPFYGKTFSFATKLNGFHSNNNGQGEGNVDQNNWPQDLGSPIYYNIVDKLSKGGMVVRRHEPTKTQYAYFKDGSGLVTYDDPQAVCDKANYVNENLLGGLHFWEMSGDLMESLETPLLDAINRKLEEPSFDCRTIASPEDGTDIPTTSPNVGPPMGLPSPEPTSLPSGEVTPSFSLGLSNDYFCGISWIDASTNCPKRCPTGEDFECDDLNNAGENQYGCFLFTGCTEAALPTTEPMDNTTVPTMSLAPSHAATAEFPTTSPSPTLQMTTSLSPTTPPTNFIPPDRPFPSGPTAPTTSPAPSTNRNYCGASQEDAQNRCAVVIPCPDGFDNVCLYGQACYQISGPCDATSYDGDSIFPPVSPAPIGVTPSPSVSPTNSPTDRHSFDRNTTNFCGINYDDVVKNCYTNRPCPTGANGECPGGQICFQEIAMIANCDTAQPTTSLSPTDFIVTDGPTSSPTTAPPTTEPTVSPTEDYIGDNFNGSVGCLQMSCFVLRSLLVSYILCRLLL
mmetsp:Transcript_15713/g.33218  ORF Transcript_15713/g.33218 Transcript_15713/m.33218 type:complete len:769 (+) Transcript_15713:917-3223(+)